MNVPAPMKVKLEGVEENPSHSSTSTLTLSPQQARAMELVHDWYTGWREAPLEARVPQVFRCFGYAGTGKTTIGKLLVEQLKLSHSQVAFCAFTGKAASVLAKKGCRPSSTVHSLAYMVDDTKPFTPGEVPEFILKPSSHPDLRHLKLLILDEVSMVGLEMGQDLLSFNIPILVLGDPAQLPPIDGTGFFTAQEPDILLTEIHRQAAESEILKLSALVRTGGKPYLIDKPDLKVIKAEDFPDKELLDYDQVICGMNKTRDILNAAIRSMRGFAQQSNLPQPGEKLVCRKNNRELGIMNGTLWCCLSCTDITFDQRILELTICDWEDYLKEYPEGANNPPDPEELLKNPRLRKIKCNARGHSFRKDLFPEPIRADWRQYKPETFEFAHAISCHISQGSEWPRVVIWDESRRFFFAGPETPRQWLYTAVTRASEHCTVILQPRKGK